MLLLVYRQKCCNCLVNIFGCSTDESANMLLPGEHGTVKLTLLWKMVMVPGQQFTIRENKVTVATGIVTDMLPAVHIPNGLGKLEL